MSETFEKLKAVLAEKETLSNEEVEKMVAEHGEMTDDEKMWLESEKHRLERAKQETVTMDQYLEALQKIDSAEEGSDEWKQADELIKKYEAGG